MASAPVRKERPSASHTPGLFYLDRILRSAPAGFSIICFFWGTDNIKWFIKSNKKQLNFLPGGEDSSFHNGKTPLRRNTKQGGNKTKWLPPFSLIEIRVIVLSTIPSKTWFANKAQRKRLLKTSHQVPPFSPTTQLPYDNEYIITEDPSEFTRSWIWRGH